MIWGTQGLRSVRGGGKDGGGGGWWSFGFVTENTCSFNIGKILFVFLVLKQLIKL